MRPRRSSVLRTSEGDSGRPRTLTSSASDGPAKRGRPFESHASSASRAGSPTGISRSRSPLPMTRRRPATGSYDVELERAHLAGAQPAAVQELEHCAIAQAPHVVVPVAVEQLRAVLRRDGIGQATAPARPDEHERGVVRALAPAHQVAEQRACRREVTGDGGRREPARGQSCLPAPQRLAAAGLGCHPLLCEETAQLVQIAAQRPHRVRRVAVRGARRQEALDGRCAGGECVISHTGRGLRLPCQRPFEH